VGYLDPLLVKRGRWDPAADRYGAAVTHCSRWSPAANRSTATGRPIRPC
jgi:hypothetical protein